MAYEKNVSRANPSCFVFLVDRSSSMTDRMAGEVGQAKKDVVADAMNRLLYELVIRCAKEEGVRGYYDVALIGYGADKAESVFSGELAGRSLVSITDIADHPLRVTKRRKKVSDGAGGLVELETDFPVWIEASANGNTPMRKALWTAQQIVQEWVPDHPHSFPPIVLNLTDGESTDGDPSALASQLTAASTEDGHALLFNLHVSTTPSSPVTYPDSDAQLPDVFARSLYGMSSVLPPVMRKYASTVGYELGDQARGFVYNADVTALIQFLDIGSVGGVVAVGSI